MNFTGNLAVAKEICCRLRDVHISLDPFVASDVTALDSTLKGINFTCKDLQTIKRAFDNAMDILGRRAFYDNGQYSSGVIIRELIRNAPDLLDISFAATDGYGYREIRDMPLIPSLPSFRSAHFSPAFNSRFGFEDEQSVSFDDQSVTIGNWIAKNINLELPNFRNSYRPGIGVSVTPTPGLTISAKFTAKCSFCREKEEDFGIPIPDGWSLGFGVTYRFGK